MKSSLPEPDETHPTRYFSRHLDTPPPSFSISGCRRKLNARFRFCVLHVFPVDCCVATQPLGHFRPNDLICPPRIVTLTSTPSPTRRLAIGLDALNRNGANQIETRTRIANTVTDPPSRQRPAASSALMVVRPPPGATAREIKTRSEIETKMSQG